MTGVTFEVLGLSILGRGKVAKSFRVDGSTVTGAHSVFLPLGFCGIARVTLAAKTNL